MWGCSLARPSVKGRYRHAPHHSRARGKPGCKNRAPIQPAVYADQMDTDAPPPPQSTARNAWRRLEIVATAPPRAARRWEQRLIAAYRGPLRAYHNVSHLNALLVDIERCADQIANHERVSLAAFFHDFIYRTWRTDNEEKSAQAAARALPVLGASPTLTIEVARLIRWTAGHAAPHEADADDRLFLDMDLAILGAEPDVYDRYARGVRREYFWLPATRFNAGRRAFLATVLARPKVFNTDRFEDERGDQARANMERERSALT